MSSPVSATEYGKYIDLQNYTGTQPATSGSIYLSGSDASERIYTMVGIHTPKLMLTGSTEVSAILDEDNMGSNSATALATQQSIKAYVDAQITAQDLDFSTDSGAGSVDLDSETLALAGSSGLDVTHSGQTVTFAIDINEVTAEGTVADGDFVLVYDADAAAHRKMTRANFIESAALDSINIDGGAIDGTVIGANSAAAGTFAALVGTSLSVSDGNITNVGVLEADTIQSDADAAGLNVNFDGNTGTNKISLADNLAEALTIEQGGNDYITFVTTNGGEYMTAGKEWAMSAGASLGADTNFAFGNNSASPDAKMHVQDDALVLSGSAYAGEDAKVYVSGALHVSGNMTVGQGADADTLTLQAAVAGSVQPSADNSYDLGHSSSQWRHLYINGKAYIDQLGEALDCDSQAMTNVNIDSGAIDGAVIGANSAAAGTFAALVGTSLNVSDGNITNVGDIALDTISADDGSSFAMGSNWTNASRTVADMGTVTTMDLNGGSIDGTVIGAASAAAGTFAALECTSLTISDGNALNVGVLEADTIQSDADGTGLNVNFDGDTGTNKISLADNLAEALTIEQGGTDYIKFVTTNGGEYMTAGKEWAMSAGASLGQDTNFAFGNNSASPDAKMHVQDDALVISGSAYAGEDAKVYLSGALHVSGNMTLGQGASEDTFTLQAAIAGHVMPSADETYDLGHASNQYRDLYIDRIAYVDQLGTDADPTTAYISGGELDGVTIGSESAAAATVTTLVATGDVDLGDATSDTVTVTARFDSDLVPSTDSARDLGTSALQWAELHCDAGYIDAITVTGTSTLTTVDINGGAIDGATIGATSANSGKFTTLGTTGAVTLGSDGSGVNMTLYGAAANESVVYSAANHTLVWTDSSAATHLTIGGDANGEYAIDVADGSNAKNKIRAAAFVTYSDERLKGDVKPMRGALKTVNSLQAVNFTWKKDGERDFGFLAQDLAKVVPQAVHGNDEGLFGVDYGRLTAVLVSAIQEQSLEIEALKAEIEKK